MFVTRKEPALGLCNEQRSFNVIIYYFYYHLGFRTKEIKVMPKFNFRGFGRLDPVIIVSPALFRTISLLAWASAFVVMRITRRVDPRGGSRGPRTKSSRTPREPRSSCDAFETNLGL